MLRRTGIDDITLLDVFILLAPIQQPKDILDRVDQRDVLVHIDVLLFTCQTKYTGFSAN